MLYSTLPYSAHIQNSDHPLGRAYDINSSIFLAIMLQSSSFRASTMASTVAEVSLMLSQMVRSFRN